MTAKVRNRIVGILLLLLLVGLLVLRGNATARGTVADFFSPLLYGQRLAEERLEGEGLFAEPKVELVRRIHALERRLEIQAVEQQQLARLDAEVADLRALLELPAPARFRFVFAEVLSYDPASGGRRLRIARGRDDGLEVGQAVLAHNALLGRVLETADRSAVVLTVTDPNCKVSVRLRDRNVHGILSGLGQERFLGRPHCELRFLPRDLEYQPGEIVETSEFGRQIPLGIVVGEIARAGDAAAVEVVDQLYRTARIRPAAMGRDLRYVAVLVVDRPLQLPNP